MTQYTIDINGKRYELNEEFRAALETRARAEYRKNPVFSCWWSVARKENHSDEAWEDNIHEEGDPILTIETEGVMVPWDRLDQLEAHMPRHVEVDGADPDDGDVEELDAGNGMKTIPPEDNPSQPSNDEIFGRTHFSLTPHRFEEIPNPGGDNPDKVPPKPIEMDGEPEMVVWLPRHPDIEHMWGAGETISPMGSWVEWNVQQRANQPRPNKDKSNSHDSFESLCRIHDCEVVAEATPSNDVPEEAGQVERKGEKAYEEGRYGGGNWHV